VSHRIRSNGTDEPFAAACAYFLSLWVSFGPLVATAHRHLRYSTVVNSSAPASASSSLAAQSRRAVLRSWLQPTTASARSPDRSTAGATSSSVRCLVSSVSRELTDRSQWHPQLCRRHLCLLHSPKEPGLLQDTHKPGKGLSHGPIGALDGRQHERGRHQEDPRCAWLQERVGLVRHLALLVTCARCAAFDRGTRVLWPDLERQHQLCAHVVL
jgi:hypothetical protein